MGELPPKRSPKRWLVTTNHKDIGVLYLLTALIFLVFAGSLALTFRLNLWAPGPAGPGLLDANMFNQFVTAHGLLMVFWFLSPFAFGFANYVVPLQIGADDLAFPRLNALSYWFYLFSGILVFLSFFEGGTFAGGWTLYAPLNVPTVVPFTEGVGSTMTVLALFMFTLSVTAGTMNFLTTIHHARAEGMGLWHMPLFTWSILLTVWMMLFAFAALLAALLLLTSDRVFTTLYFGTADGSGLLWTHLFWFFGHPEVYIVFFPALGIMFETFQTFCGRRLVGRKWVIIALILVAVQSFLVWMHHMFLTTINIEIKTLMMATTIGISLPFDLMVFALIYTMVKGRVRFTTPFLFNLGALVLFILGGITGVFLGAVVLDYEFRGTYWVVAHFHYVMVSGATALVGGLYYWYPKMTGRMYDEFLGKLHFALFFFGFNLLYFPMFLAWETPRRVFHFADEMTIWHQLATVGAFVFGLSFLIMFYNLGKSLRTGPKAPDNPWRYARTAEWAIPSPPPLENWTGRPSYASGHLEFVDDGPAGHGAVADGGSTVTGGGSTVTDGGAVETTAPDIPGDPSLHEDVHPDHASIWPFGIAAGLFLFFWGLSGLRPWFEALDPAADPSLGLLYPAVTVAGIGVLGVTLYKFGVEDFRAPPMEYAERWPFDRIEKNKLGVWFFLASDVVVFGAAIGAYLFLRIYTGWGDWTIVPPEAWPGLLNTYILLTSSFTVIMALVMARRKHKTGMFAFLAATVILGLGFMGVKAWEWSVKFAENEYWFTGIEYSVYYVTTGLHGLHVILGLFIAVFMLYRIWRVDAYLEDERPVEYFGLYWHFVDIVWVFLFPLFYLM